MVVWYFYLLSSWHYNNMEAEELTLTFQALFAVLALQATNAEVRIAKVVYKSLEDTLYKLSEDFMHHTLHSLSLCGL